MSCKVPRDRRIWVINARVIVINCVFASATKEQQDKSGEIREKEEASGRASAEQP